jgi:hypothetical protein
LLVAGLVSCLLVGVVGTASAATTLKLTLKETSSKDTPTGFTARDNIFQNGAKVGTSRAVCKYVIPSGSDNPTGANCKATFTLPDGKLRISASFAFESGRGPVKVTGGTGEYAGASGTGTVRLKANDDTVFTLRLN